jgi:hypothetical protein
MPLLVDWSQFAWFVAGFFMVMFFALAIGSRNHYKKGEEAGQAQGWHDRQHWETDAVVKGKLERP